MKLKSEQSKYSFMPYFPPIFPWSRARQKTAKQLFNQLLAYSREPRFYTDLAVPDTFDGRFELLTLFVALLSSRLSTEGRNGAKLSQALFDEMFLNVELGCREVGIGDLGVPRHMQRMMKAFNGRLNAYQSDDIKGALQRNLYGTVNDIDEHILNAMTEFVIQIKSNLNAQSFNDLNSGILNNNLYESQNETNTKISA